MKYRQLYREVPRLKGIGTIMVEATPEECIAAQKELDRRNARREEIKAQVKGLQDELDELRNCDHLLRYDEDGWPYIQRYCGVCGAFIASI